MTGLGGLGGAFGGVNSVAHYIRFFEITGLLGMGRIYGRSFFVSNCQTILGTFYISLSASLYRLQSPALSLLVVFLVNIL